VSDGARVARVACPLDCPDACSLEVTVRAGRVERIEGAGDRNPLTDGYLCTKVRTFAEHVDSTERIDRPMRRIGSKGEGRFEPLSWDDALDLVATRLLAIRDESGGEAILPHSYGGSNGLLTQNTTDRMLFERLGASRLLRTICAAAAGRAAEGLTGKMSGVALPDYEASRLIVIWGANPQATGIHLVPIVRRAQAAGATLVVVDPRRAGLAAQADLHLAVRPGTDLPVALAVLRALFERGAADLEFLDRHAVHADELRRRAEPWSIARAAAIAGLAPADLERFVELYATLSPAVVRCGWGLERNRNGGSAVAAVLALPAVAGKFGVRGGGYTQSNSGAWTLDAGIPLAGERRAINMNRLGRALLELDDPPIRALFVYNSNPLSTSPRQDLVARGLAREDLFTVVHDAVWTDTARWADVVLPATTFLEHEEISRGYGAYVLQHSRPAIPPRGEARSNHDLFADLLRRTGCPETEIPSIETLRERVLDSTGDGARVRAELDDRGWAAPSSGVHPVQFVDVFPNTPDRKIDLVPAALDAEVEGGLYRYREDPEDDARPLALVSPASGKLISSSFGQRISGPVPVELHPDDAAARGLSSGDRVRIHNAFGEVVTTLRVTRNVRPGVASLPKGLWARHTLNGATSNVLCPDDLTDLAGGACFNDARVEISPTGERPD